MKVGKNVKEKIVFSAEVRIFQRSGFFESIFCERRSNF